jgi:hypothetical protein
MECENNSCIECTSFKRLITPTAVVKKLIAEIFGDLDGKVKYVGNGIWIYTITIEGKVIRKVIKCEREDVSWSDYCIRCFLDD